MNEYVRSLFTLAPMIQFRSVRKLSSYLVRAKLYPLERTIGSVQCKGKRYQTNHNVKDRNFYQYNHGKTFKINHKLNLNDKCPVYLLTCNVCLKHMFDKQSRNLGIDGTIAKAMVVNIKSMTHVCSNIFLSIFVRRDTIVLWEMSLLH